MAEDPQTRFEHDLSLDPGLDSAAREGLTGTAPANAYGAERGPEDVTVPPDARPFSEQPAWRRDFAIDWPRDHEIARRQFAKFMVLTSGAFVVGQSWIAAQSLLRMRKQPPERKRIALLDEVAPGSVRTFSFPGEHDPCLLIRTQQGELLAYSQKCTHLSCAVVPKLAEGVLHCPCHEGYFDLQTGRNLAGPPPRPLTRIVVEVEGRDVYAVAEEPRTI
jgi:nitrite reductase/ring-hydroxylating ferredoxin subunit